MESQNAAAQKIFFSYSRTDGQEHALKLANDLRGAGANVWIDQLDIELGKLWDLEVEKALNTADCVLFIATEKSTTSNNVLNEVYYALDENKKVIPVVFHDCRIPFQLRRLQRIDFTADYEAAFQRLLKALGLRSETETPAQNAESKNVPLAIAHPTGPQDVQKRSETLQEIPPVPPAPSVHRLDVGEKVLPIQNAEKATASATENLISASTHNEKSKSRKGLFWGVGALAAAALIFVLVKAFSGSEQPAKNDAAVLSKQYDSTLGKDTGSVQPLTNNISNAAVNKQASSKTTLSHTGETAASVGEKYNRYFQSGMDRYNNKAYKEAITDFTNAASVRDDAEPFFYIGLCYSGLQDYPNAIIYYSKAIERNPKNLKYVGSRAAAHHNNKDFQASVNDWNQVILLAPGNAEAYFRRGVNKRALNDATGACDDFATAAKMGNDEGKKNYDRYCGTATQPAINLNRYGANKLVEQKKTNLPKKIAAEKKTDY